MHEKAEQLTNLLAAFPKLDHVFNPLADYDLRYDAYSLAPDIRRKQFRSYINSRIYRAKVVLIGDSMSYQDAKFTGISMLDEQVLLGKKASAPFDYKAIIDVQPHQTSSLELMFSENRYGNYAGTILYNFLYKHNISPREVVTWDAFPFHTHNAGDLLSNRPVRQYEIEAVHNIQREFFGIFKGCKMITLTSSAQAMLDDIGIDNVFISHPLQSGAKTFTKELSKYLLPATQVV